MAKVGFTWNGPRWSGPLIGAVIAGAVTVHLIRRRR
jgi:hypothetical protein